MNKPRKYNGVYKLPIKKHTKVRRPMSRWQLEYMLFENNPVLISNTLKMSVPPIKVNDISIGLENPLNLVPPFVPFENDIMGAWGKDMEKQWYDNMKSVKEEDFGRLFEDKPSLLTRVRERLKRKGRR